MTKPAKNTITLFRRLHKSLRGSDPDAGLYWLARMLEAGEDPLYIVRRLIRFASEDVGMADPQALVLCYGRAAGRPFHRHARGRAGASSGRRASGDRAQEQRALPAYGAVRDDVRATRNDGVPLHLRNAPTRLMKELDYGQGYTYAHDLYAGEPDPDDLLRPPPRRPQTYLPEVLGDRAYYHPTAQGAEASIQRWLARRRAASSPPTEPSPS